MSKKLKSQMKELGKGLLQALAAGLAAWLACCCGSKDHVRLVDCCGYPQESARVRLERKRWPTLIDSRRFRQHLKSPYRPIPGNGRKLRESIKRRMTNGYAMPTSPFLHVQHNTVGQSHLKLKRGEEDAEESRSKTPSFLPAPAEGGSVFINNGCQ